MGRKRARADLGDDFLSFGGVEFLGGIVGWCWKKKGGGVIRFYRFDG